MFWSGNYVVVRETSFLLKDENVTLTQLLEADDILQECRADNKALVLFLTKPNVIAELITLITEEPSKNVELQSQYRYASVACEILSSNISTLSDRLSNDAVQMNRLCDFINREPPLNPLLASFFSKTVGMLLERGSKMDWYSYHIVCLRVLDFFKSRTDFLPNLFRHIGTSAIMDIFKYFIRLDLFSKMIMEWLEAHQFLETLIQILCGSYLPDEVRPFPTPPISQAAPSEAPPRLATQSPEGVNGCPSEDTHGDGTGCRSPDDQDRASDSLDSGAELSGDRDADRLMDYRLEVEQARVKAGQSASAASLLCDIVQTGCSGEGCSARQLMARCKSEEMVSLLLQSIFTSPLEFRRHALVNGVQVLLALLTDNPLMAGQPDEFRNAVELAVAPHLPLLHQALLQEPAAYVHAAQVGSGPKQSVVGMARLQVVTLMAQLAVSDVQEVASTLITLGTPGILLDMIFQCPGNNFLHAQVYQLVDAALSNMPYRTQYAKYLISECELLTRLMDAFIENENKRESMAARSGYMGHVLLMLRRVQRMMEGSETEPSLVDSLQLPPALLEQWKDFLTNNLQPVLTAHDTPLGGYYPSETCYEIDNLAESLAANYDFNDIGAMAVGEDYQGDSLTVGEGIEYLNEARQRRRDLYNDSATVDNGAGLWDDDEEEESEGKKYARFQEILAQNKPDADELTEAVSPWDKVSDGSGNSTEEGWAQFGDNFAGEGFGAPEGSFGANDFASACQPQDFATFWNYSGSSENRGSEGPAIPKLANIEQSIQDMQLDPNIPNNALSDATSAELASQVSNLLTTIMSISPNDLANLVNANLSQEEIDNNLSQPQEVVAELDERSSHPATDKQEADTESDISKVKSQEEVTHAKVATVEDKSSESTDSIEATVAKGKEGISHPLEDLVNAETEIEEPAATDERQESADTKAVSEPKATIATEESKNTLKSSER